MSDDLKRYNKAIQAGSRYNEREQWGKAMRAFRVAIDEFPKSPEAYAGLGEACLGLKELGRALDCFKLAARYSRGDAAYLQRVADIQERQGLLGEAGRTYMAIGEIQLKGRQLNEAIGNWQRAVRLEPGLLGAHKRLAMVFQRQQRTRDAVRAYLSIARILQMRGDTEKALRMCQAAQRLDPENDDVQQAIALIQMGARGFEEEAEPETAVPAEPELTISDADQAEADRMTAVVRQMAEAFEAERVAHTAPLKLPEDPITAARQMAQEQLAEELFRDEDESDDATPDGGLTKLERDALLGQGMDFESRGEAEGAIKCYQQAIDGGLKLPAAHFLLGMLHLDMGDVESALSAWRVAATEPMYAKAIKTALKR